MKSFTMGNAERSTQVQIEGTESPDERALKFSLGVAKVEQSIDLGILYLATLFVADQEGRFTKDDALSLVLTTDEQAPPGWAHARRELIRRAKGAGLSWKNRDIYDPDYMSRN